MSVLDNLYIYSMFCTTENKNVLTILQSPSTPVSPTGCPNDPLHTVTNVNLVNTLYKDTVSVLVNKQENLLTNSNYFIESQIFNISKQSYSTMYINYPFNISLYAVTFKSQDVFRDDKLEIYTVKDAVLGSPINPLSISDTVITVSPSIINYLNVGYFITLTENSTVNNVGRIININVETFEITVEIPLTNNFSTSSILKLSVKFGNIIFDREDKYTCGANKYGSSFVSKNNPIILDYYNNSGGVKTLNFIVEYLY